MATAAAEAEAAAAAAAAAMQDQMGGNLALQALPTRRLLLTTPGEKLLAPANFNKDEPLRRLAFHRFNTTGSVKKKIDTDMAEWVSPDTVYALLGSAELFWVNISDKARFHGGCAVVKSSVFAEDITNPSGYSEDEDARVKEKKMKKSEVSRGETSTPLPRRFDTSGKVWNRRRYTLDDDDEQTFSFVQWMDSKTAKLKEKPVAANLSDIAAHVKTLDESYKAMHKELSEMKTLMKNCSTLSDASLALAQSLKEMVTDQSTAQTTLSDQIAKLCSELHREI